MSGRLRLGHVGVIAVALLLVAGTVPAVHGQPTDSDRSALVVTLEESGTAHVQLVLTYDLETDSERTAFRELQNNQTARETVRERFRDRLSAVARDASTATGREMTISDASIDLSTADNGSMGIVELSVIYEGFAAVSDRTLTVTEPFASGFQSNRPVVLVGPDGATLESSTVAPDSTDGARATWNANRDLSGFETTFTIQTTATDATSSPAATTGTSSGDGPGFGVLAAVGAIVAVGLLKQRSVR